jgi:hypothetical protein
VRLIKILQYHTFILNMFFLSFPFCIFLYYPILFNTLIQTVPSTGISPSHSRRVDSRSNDATTICICCSPPNRIPNSTPSAPFRSDGPYRSPSSPSSIPVGISSPKSPPERNPPRSALDFGIGTSPSIYSVPCRGFKNPSNANDWPRNNFPNPPPCPNWRPTRRFTSASVAVAARSRVVVVVAKNHRGTDDPSC